MSQLSVAPVEPSGIAGSEWCVADEGSVWHRVGLDYWPAAAGGCFWRCVAFEGAWLECLFDDALGALLDGARLESTGLGRWLRAHRGLPLAIWYTGFADDLDRMAWGDDVFGAVGRQLAEDQEVYLLVGP